jgi:hypothetical protein
MVEASQVANAALMADCCWHGGSVWFAAQVRTTGVATVQVSDCVNGRLCRPQLSTYTHVLVCVLVHPLTVMALVCGYPGARVGMLQSSVAVGATKELLGLDGLHPRSIVA